KPRQHAEADAMALVRHFMNKDHVGVAKDRVKLLLGSGPVADIPSEKATKANILKALHWMEKNAKKDDLTILAIFGNGAPVGDRTCYFAVDSTFKNRAQDAVLSDDIEHVIDKVPSQRLVSMIDVHYLGFNSGKEKVPDLTTGKIFQVFLSQQDETKEHSPSRVLFIAGAASKPSLDLNKHGIFAQALLDGLGGQADAEGYEADGNIMVSELAKFMRKHVGDLARANGKTDEQKKQQSGAIEAQTTDFVIGYNPQARTKSVARLKKFADLADAKRLDKKFIDEGNTLLARMPKLEAQRSLRKAYQQLVDGKIDVAGFNAERDNILEGRKLAEKDAARYAYIMMRATELVGKSYYKKVEKAALVAHAVNGMYKAIDENVPASLNDRLERIKELDSADLLRLLSEARQQLGKREDLAKGQDVTLSLNAMLGKLDRHTGYIPPEVVLKFREDTSGSFRGIGVQIRRNEARDQLQVVTPIFNSPAYKAGLRAEDIITVIISEVDPATGIPYDEPKLTPTKGMTTEDAVKLIKGKANTRVKLLVEREGEKKPIEFTLIRKDIEVESVLGHKRGKDDAWNYVIDPENRICYVRLTQFSENTYPELEKLMKKLSKEGIKGFILDLRFNPGGLLDSSIKISDLFIDDGLIVTIRQRDGKETSYVGRSDGSYITFPMVCLINGGSASASEIVSACLQDHGRAIIIGSRSFGKGSVQTIHGFENQSIIKLTTATFWRPSGRNLNKSSTGGKDTDEWGVTPNKGYEINLSKKEEADLFEHLREAEVIRGSPPAGAPPREARTDFRDRQLDAAVDYLRNQIRGQAKKDGGARDIENR
ncbi:MAG: S41 family peptidase, partial [Planctomycetes bacterium]|nr:S41 family peptidase [Planctomycetota bacterium]